MNKTMMIILIGAVVLGLSTITAIAYEKRPELKSLMVKLKMLDYQHLV